MSLANQKKPNLGENNYFSGCQEMDENVGGGGGEQVQVGLPKQGAVRPSLVSSGPASSFLPSSIVLSPQSKRNTCIYDDTNIWFTILAVWIDQKPIFCPLCLPPISRGRAPLSPLSLSSVVCFSVLASEKDFFLSLVFPLDFCPLANIYIAKISTWNLKSPIFPFASGNADCWVHRCFRGKFLNLCKWKGFVSFSVDARL